VFNQPSKEVIMRWFGQGTLLIVILAFFAGGLAPQALTQQQSCDQVALTNLVNRYLQPPFMQGGFGFIDASQFDFTTFPAFTGEGPMGITPEPITVSLNTYIEPPTSGFVGYESNEPGPFRVEPDGSITGSLVALYFAEGRKGETLAGYLLNKDGWFFIEPIRPLLMPLIPRDHTDALTTVNNCATTDISYADNTEYFYEDRA
jgi:hypothetical protein